MHRAERWLSTIPNLVERKLLVAYAKSELYQGTLGEVAAALDVLCTRVEQSDPVARTVIGAFVPLVIDPHHHGRTSSIRATALASDMLAVGRFLRCATPEGHAFERERQPDHGDVLQKDDGKPFTLGERRALARQPTRQNLEKLLRDPHPMVVRIVLANPRITENDVVRIAAHRPANPEIVVEVAKAWCHHQRVRNTLVLNPGSPTAVSVPLLSLMARPELHQVSRAADLPAVLRATAHDLWSLRPPMPPADEPVVKH